MEWYGFYDDFMLLYHEKCFIIVCLQHPSSSAAVRGDADLSCDAGDSFVWCLAGCWDCFRRFSDFFP